MIRKILPLILLLLLNTNVYGATNWCNDANINACHPFDGVNEAAALLDVSSNNIDLSNTGATWVNSGCSANDCFDFSNAYEYLEDVDYSTFHAEWTLTSWIDLDALPPAGGAAGNDGFIAGQRKDKDGTQNYANWQFVIEDDDDQYNLVYYNSGWNTIDFDITATTTAVYLAVTWSNTSNDGKLYQDGVLTKTVNNATDQANNGSTVEYSIGAHINNTEGLDGRIDEVGFFSDVKDLTDINEIMDYGLLGTSGVVINKSQVIGGWLF